MMPERYPGFTLLEMPDVRPLPRPLIHSACQQDLQRLFPDRQQGMILKVQMEKRLKFFESHKQTFLEQLEWFEPIESGDAAKGIPPLYSMRFNHSKDLKNLRILFTVREQTMLLIFAFKEKRKKDYQSAIETAKERIKGMR